MQSWFSQESQEKGSWPEQVPLQSTSFPSGPALRNRRFQSEPGKIFGFENSTTGYTCNLQPVRPLISAKCPQATGQSQKPTREPLQVKMLCLAPKGGLFFFFELLVIASPPPHACSWCCSQTSWKTQISEDTPKVTSHCTNFNWLGVRNEMKGIQKTDKILSG